MYSTLPLDSRIVNAFFREVPEEDDEDEDEKQDEDEDDDKEDEEEGEGYSE